MTETYIIRGGQEGADRLHILANVTWKYTHPFLLEAGLKSGMKCLDVGCGNGVMSRRLASIVGEQGHVTGVDFDPTVIEIAGKEILGNVDFHVMNIETDSLPGGPYDFIYCRFILSHLTSPATVITKCKSALRSGGILAIEDVDFDGHFCHPPCQAFDTYVKWYAQIGRMKGGNPTIGPEVINMISAAGFEDITLNVVLPAFHAGDGKRMGVLTLHAIRDAVIKSNLATPHEFDSVLKELEDFTKDESSIISLPRIFQISSIPNGS